MERHQIRGSFEYRKKIVLASTLWMAPIFLLASCQNFGNFWDDKESTATYDPVAHTFTSGPATATGVGAGGISFPY